jgi:hypothetical protein
MCLDRRTTEKCNFYLLLFSAAVDVVTVKSYRDTPPKSPCVCMMRQQGRSRSPAGDRTGPEKNILIISATMQVEVKTIITLPSRATVTNSPCVRGLKMTELGGACE